MRVALFNPRTRPLSLDVMNSDGEMIRPLVEPLATVVVTNIDPYYLNQDQFLRALAFAGDVVVTFLPDPDDLVTLGGFIENVLWNGAPVSGGPFNTLNFTGAGVTATGAGDTATILIPGGGGGTAAVLSFTAERILTTTVTRYLFAGGGYDNAPTVPRALVAPSAGTLSRLRVIQNEPDGNGNNIVYTVRVAGVATALAVTMASTDTTGFNVLSTAAVAAGDSIDVRVTKAASIGASPRGVVATMEIG